MGIQEQKLGCSRSYRKLYAIFLFFVFQSVQLFSQTFDAGIEVGFIKAQIYQVSVKYGTGGMYAPPPDTVKSASISAGVLGAFFSANIPVYKFNEEKVIFCQPQVHLAGGGGIFMFYAPLNIGFKYGTDATVKAKSKFGYALSGGYKFAAMEIEGGPLYYWTPNVMGEINFVLGESTLMKLGSYYNFVSSVNRVYGYDVDKVFSGSVHLLNYKTGIFVSYAINF